MKTRKLPVGGTVCDVELYFDEQNSRPGILLLPDITGLVPSLRATARALRDEGFQVMLPDLYSMQGAVRYCLRQLFDRATRDNHAESHALREIEILADHLAQMPGVLPGRLGCVGQCLTGGFALHMALRPDMRAPVVFHHSFGRTGGGFPVDCAQRVTGKIQGHFVHLDPFTPRERILKLAQDLGEHLEINYYDWTPHGIPHLFRVTEQGARAWTNMLRFLKMQLLATATS